MDETNIVEMVNNSNETKPNQTKQNREKRTDDARKLVFYDDKLSCGLAT